MTEKGDKLSQKIEVKKKQHAALLERMNLHINSFQKHKDEANKIGQEVLKLEGEVRALMELNEEK